MVNYIAKMMIERQMSKLEQKLPRDQLILIYRKFAVFNAGQKNNADKYGMYLRKLWKISKTQTIITILCVPLLKVSNSITVSAKGFSTLLKLSFQAHSE